VFATGKQTASYIMSLLAEVVKQFFEFVLKDGIKLQNVYGKEYIKACIFTKKCVNTFLS